MCVSLGSCNRQRWVRENEDTTPPRFRQGDCLYCRYEGENSQKHFEAGHERREMGESMKEKSAKGAKRSGMCQAKSRAT